MDTGSHGVNEILDSLRDTAEGEQKVSIGALLHGTPEGRSSPYPRSGQPAGLVTGRPSVV